MRRGNRHTGCRYQSLHFESEAYTYLLHQQSIVNLQSMLRCHLTHALEVVICLVQNAVLEILQKKKQCVDGVMIMCAAIADM